ncbi:MAG: hypothetical protein JWM90_1659 [Thermoleophilia bacterium]|nr:hypothetical protein [Thermoleophilia bacterium]
MNAALRVLDGHVRALVRVALVQQSLRENDVAAGVAEFHERCARLLHAVSLEHGTDAMSTASEYAVTSLEAGLLYPDELDSFIRSVAGSVRATSRDLTKATPFGS